MQDVCVCVRACKYIFFQAEYPSILLQVKIEAAIASGLALYLRAQAKGLRAAHVEFEVHAYTLMYVDIYNNVYMYMYISYIHTYIHTCAEEHIQATCVYVYLYMIQT